jgi:glycosyltransferase involved in cell wall biosynthesis
MTEKIRVLFLLDCLYGNAGGGSERQFLKLYQQSETLGIIPFVVFLRHATIHQKLPWLHPPHVLDLNSLISTRLYKSLCELKSFIKINHIQIVHTLFDDATIIGILLKIIQPNIPVICSQRNLGHAHQGIKKKLIANSLRNADRVLVNANIISEMLVTDYHVSRQNILMIPNIHEPILANKAPRADKELNKLKQDDHKIVLTIANLREVKGIDDLIAAARLLQHKPIRFVVVGDGGGYAEYYEKIRSYGLLDKVVLLGQQEDVSPYLLSADIAVLPSRSEGSSNALIEYMLAGLPIIATNVGGNAEALGENNYCSLLIPPRHPELMAQMIDKLIVDQALAKRLGLAAQKRANSLFMSNTVLALYRTLYNELAT